MLGDAAVNKQASQRLKQVIGGQAALHALVVYTPAGKAQKTGNRAIAIAAEPFREVRNRRHQSCFIIFDPQTAMLCRARLAEDSASSSLRGTELALRMQDKLTSPLRA